MISGDQILQEMVITEKATELSSHVNQYTFRVHPSASRIRVAEAIEKAFGVKVSRVNIINTKPKAKRDRVRRGRLGYRSGMKKAIISLQEGDKIEVL